MTSASFARSILVVEDDVDIRDSVIEILTDRGFAASGAMNGDEALEQLRSPEPLPMLILLDLLMPVMDGHEFRRLQLADPRLAPIPTIVLSANARLAEHAAALGAPWLRKPVGIRELLAAIEEQLPKDATTFGSR
ncbi:MAG: response regulator [Myxococcota bacterium]|nr:response regulator [Myxococcota bacterium]